MNQLLKVEGLVKSFRGVRASDGVNFEVRAGEIHAVIGPNGAGKTTLINQLMGEVKPDSGKIILDGHDITYESPRYRSVLGMARSFQITAVFDDLNVLENISIAVLSVRRGFGMNLFDDIAADRDISEAALKCIEMVGLSEMVDVRAGDLAHGARRQLELAMVVATKPRIMLLDEPMAGTGPGESREIVDLLRRIRTDAAIVLIEHDLDAVFALADRISVLVYGKVIATGSCDEIRNNDAVREAYIGDEEYVL